MKIVEADYEDDDDDNDDDDDDDDDDCDDDNWASLSLNTDVLKNDQQIFH